MTTWRRGFAAFFSTVMLNAAVPAHAQPPGEPPLLRVLIDTGQKREGLHVFGPHPQAASIESSLGRGFPAKMVRLYRLEQRYLARSRGTAVEPAYLEFSRRQGGFPGFGFWLGAEPKRGVGYVDLFEPRSKRPRFGGTDQIFPHELAHVIVQQLAGDAPRGGSRQGHAIGVRTDPFVAFDEGYAEHFQVMALADPDADPGTRALLADPYWNRNTERELAAYRRTILARWAPAARSRIGFLFWFSGTEQYLRYAAVKANTFARQPAIPERLLRTSDPYAAYLLENILPGEAGDSPKPASALVATEGVVSTLFFRWATSEGLRERYRDEAFYARFAAARRDIPPEINVYLKQFFALAEARPRTVPAFVRAYCELFPEDAGDVEAIVREVLLGQALPGAPELWLENADFRVGTRVFDQFRSMPRPHSFDLNAASEVDLVAVPGVSLELARAIRARAPYSSIEALRQVPGVTAGLVQHFTRMAASHARGPQAAGEYSTFSRLLWSFGRRALVIWLAAGALATMLIRRVRDCGWPRAAVSGLGASLVALAANWVLGSTVWTLAAPLLLFGVPGLLATLRARPLLPALRTTALAWLLAVAPALLLTAPLL